MNRRDFIAGSMSAGLLATSAVGAFAHESAPVIGLLDGACGHRLLDGINRGLEEAGLVAGKDFRFEYSRWIGAEFEVDQIARHAAEFVRRQVALIIAFSNTAALAAKAAANITPILFLADDLADHSFAAGLVDGAGNLTGVACLVSGLTRKRIEIAREMVPAANHVAFVTDPTNAPAHDIEIREAQAAAAAFNLQLSIVGWTGERSIDADIAALANDGKTLLVLGTGVPFLVRYAILSYLAARDRIPAIHAYRTAVEDGGLASVGACRAEGAHQMGVYAARILKGGEPRDLPVRQITGSELVINRGVARSLGLQMSSALLARADEVID